MRIVTAVVAAAALTLMSAPSFAADKPDLDALLKQIFHGKPGATIPAPKGHTLKDLLLFWPWDKPAAK